MEIKKTRNHIVITKGEVEYRIENDLHSNGIKIYVHDFDGDLVVKPCVSNVIVVKTVKDK